jgi:hypothetical protein
VRYPRSPEFFGLLPSIGRGTPRRTKLSAPDPQNRKFGWWLCATRQRPRRGKSWKRLSTSARVTPSHRINEMTIGSASISQRVNSRSTSCGFVGCFFSSQNIRYIQNRQQHRCGGYELYGFQNDRTNETFLPKTSVLLLAVTRRYIVRFRGRSDGGAIRGSRPLWAN